MRRGYMDNYIGLVDVGDIHGIPDAKTRSLFLHF